MVQRDGVERLIKAVLHVVVEVNAGSRASALAAVAVLAAGVAGSVASGVGAVAVGWHAGSDRGVALALVVFLRRRDGVVAAAALVVLLVLVRLAGDGHRTGAVVLCSVGGHCG